MPRVPQHRYRDPLDQVWLACAERLGFRVARAPDVYASTDGRRTLLIGAPETLDPDDCLAQMIFHELCHALVEGPEALEKPDWGLDNQTDRDVPREQACLRLQAALAAPYGLRRLLAPTTDFRDFYDALPADPLDSGTWEDETVRAARAGAWRASAPPWSDALAAALGATETIARAATPFAAAGREPRLASLWSVLDARPARHATGLPAAAPGTRAASETCASCAWRHETGRERVASRCRQGERRRVDPAWPACACWEPALDCQTCAACCREAYDAVSVGPREPLARAHPELVVLRGAASSLRRDGERCAALGGGRQPGEPFACRVYDLRPRTCRDFLRGGEHCLIARRRVGLSR